MRGERSVLRVWWARSMGGLRTMRLKNSQGSEHARMNIIQLVIRERTSFGWPHEP